MKCRRKALVIVQLLKNIFGNFQPSFVSYKTRTELYSNPTFKNENATRLENFSQTCVQEIYSYVPSDLVTSTDPRYRMYVCFYRGKTFAFAFFRNFIFLLYFLGNIFCLQTSFPTIEILYSVTHNYSPVISFLIPILFILLYVSNLNRSRNSIMQEIIIDYRWLPNNYKL